MNQSIYGAQIIVNLRNRKMMAFYLRKLRSTLRLVPSTQTPTPSFDFTTRASESENEKTRNFLQEKRKSVCVSSRMQETCVLPRDVSLVVMDEVAQNVLPVIVPPAKLRCMSYRNVHEILQDGSVATVSTPREEFELLTNTLKAVDLTTDDILVHPFGGSNDGDYIRSVSERVPVDILTSMPLKNFHFNMSQCDLRESSAESLEEFFRATSDHLGLDRRHSDSSAVISDTNTFKFSVTGATPGKDGSKKNGPTPEQMHDAREKLISHIESLLHSSYDYGIIDKNITFENNLFGTNKVTRGQTWYALALLRLRLVMSFKYASAGVDVMNVTSLEQNGVIRIHWRLSGIPHGRILKFRRINPEDKETLEAFSYFHIGNDGLVHKHRIDRTLPDDGKEPNTLKKGVQKLTGILNPGTA